MKDVRAHYLKTKMRGETEEVKRKAKAFFNLPEEIISVNILAYVCICFQWVYFSPIR